MSKKTAGSAVFLFCHMLLSCLPYSAIDFLARAFFCTHQMTLRSK